jgi:putative tryptophan/tyrosine transport system substrate-binding protein
MRRREFIAGLGSIAACPVSARAQQRDRVRRVGIIMPYPSTDAESRAFVQALQEDLRKLGWVEGLTVQFDEYWTTDDMDRVRRAAADLVQSKPDVVVATGGRVLPILKQMTRTIPIVFAGTADPVGAGLVDSLARPGGNLTGLSVYEFSVIGKALDILKKIVPAVSHVALIFNPDNPTTKFFVSSFEASAGSLGIRPVIAPIHGISEIDRTIATLASEPNGGLMFAPDVTIDALHDEIVATVARHRLPAIYSQPLLVKSGGLVSYSSDRIDMFRRAAAYIDRILHGENPGDLPVQEPTKYVLAINLKTANKLGIVVPPTLVAIADEVIE